MSSASGFEQAKASHEVLVAWNMVNNVKALVFDTTASNSGWNKGAAKLLEERIGRKLLYHACRHHIYELIVRDVWKSLFGSITTGPENTDFNKFKQAWHTMDLSRPYETLHINDHLREKAEHVVNFLGEALETRHFLRDDYKQCVTNALALLGVADQRTFTHQKPGATHSARWMGTVLYVQKMFMFSRQMGYSEDYIKLLHRMNTFVCLFYVPAWVDSSKGSNAAVNDLNFIKDMYEYLDIDTVVAEAAMHKIKKHSWYMLEETVVYALFSDHADVTYDTKEQIANKLLSIPQPAMYRTGVPTRSKAITRDTSLQDLIGENSWYIFNALHVSSDWLSLPVDQWNDCDEYIAAKTFLQTVKVVNDAAERGVKLATDYAAIITDDDEQKASLLQSVELHRKTYPDTKKSTLQ